MKRIADRFGRRRFFRQAPFHVQQVLYDCYICFGSHFKLLFFITADSLLEFSNGVNVYTVMGLVAFTIISSFIHELGHASACKHFGLKHGGIGFGLYLNFPVLYTDVTEIWKLNRKNVA